MQYVEGSYTQKAITSFTRKAIALRKKPHSLSVHTQIETTLRNQPHSLSVHTHKETTLRNQPHSEINHNKHTNEATANPYKFLIALMNISELSTCVPPNTTCICPSVFHTSTVCASS